MTHINRWIIVNVFLIYCGRQALRIKHNMLIRKLNSVLIAHFITLLYF